MTVPHRDNVNIPASLGPSENHHPAIEKSRRVLAQFAIVKAIIEPSRVITLEHLGRVRQIKAAIGEGGGALGGIESDFHRENKRKYI